MIMRSILFFYCTIVQVTVVATVHEYLGCFNDQIGQRDLEKLIGDYENLTVEQCLRACRAEHYSYAGIQFGTECRCGNQYGRYGRVKNEQCTHQCSTTDRCGGNYLNSIYRVNDVPNSASMCQNNLSGYQGCFSTRLFTVIEGPVNSIEQCIEQCAQNHQYAGIRNGYLCQCGNQLNHLSYSSHLCNIPCNRSINEYKKNCCGGRNALSVYSVKRYRSSTDKTIVEADFKMNDESETVIRVKRDGGSVNSVPTIVETDGKVANDTTTSTTTAPVTYSPLYKLTTVFIVRDIGTFNASANSTLELIRQRLSAVINLAFQCSSNPANSNCSSSGRRRKRQGCSSVYNANLVSHLTQISNTTPGTYSVDYIVFDACNPSTPVLSSQVVSAVSVLPRARIVDVLGYDFTGSFARAASFNTLTSTETPDRKLWLIGATIGPVAFVLLLVYIFCYLHYKCRPRQSHQLLPKAVSPAPPVSARSAIQTYQNLNNEPQTDRSVQDKNISVLVQKPRIPSEPLRDFSSATPNDGNMEVPLDELRRQNDVERWRNKLRLQERYQPSPVEPRLSSEPYTNRAFHPDPSQINILPIENMRSEPPIVRPPTESSSITQGRAKLHRLLDEVIDQAGSESGYDPDSEIERINRRRQRRHLPPITYDQPPVTAQTETTSHFPVIAQVSARPNQSIVRLHHDPYEAGDKTYSISRFNPVELQPKFTHEEEEEIPQRLQTSTRANPPLYLDDSVIPDRAATATNAYAAPKRIGRARIETDREAEIRHEGGRVNPRERSFQDDGVHLNSISKNPFPPQGKGDYRDEYLMAKRSVANTRNIISTIHDELQHITYQPSDSYHA